MSNSSNPISDASPLKLFLMGSTGTIALYCVFWFRNMDVVQQHLSHGISKALVSALLLLILAAIAGLVVSVSRPGSYKAAFIMGLGLPSLIFAANIEPPTEPREFEQHVDGNQEVATRLEPRQWDSIRMVMTPFSVVGQHREDETMLRVDRQLQAVADDPTEDEQVRVSADELRQRLVRPRVVVPPFPER